MIHGHSYATDTAITSVWWGTIFINLYENMQRNICNRSTTFFKFKYPVKILPARLLRVDEYAAHKRYKLELLTKFLNKLLSRWTKQKCALINFGENFPITLKLFSQQNKKYKTYMEMRKKATIAVLLRSCKTFRQLWFLIMYYSLRLNALLWW